MTDIMPAMPPAVASAINAVMAEVPKLAKSEKNSHGNYNFASIDDFLEAVRPLCATHGLIIIQDEESYEVRDGWLILKFRFTLAHKDGETWAHRPARSIMVNAKMGAQAYGAAQSYALKQFERSLFQIATGEKGEDADTHPGANLPTYGAGEASASGGAVPPATVSEQEAGPPKDSRDPRWQGPLTKTELTGELRELCKRIGDAQTLDEVREIEDEYGQVIGQAEHDTPGWMTGVGMPPEFVPVNKRFAAKRNFLKGMAQQKEKAA